MASHTTALFCTSRKHLLHQYVCAVWFLALVVPAAAQAQLTYEANSGSVTITGYTGWAGAISIPDTLDGLPVSNIGDNAFYGRTSLASITIPASVTNIGVSAFFSCINLTNISGGDGISSIENSAFGGCDNLTVAFIPTTVTSIGVSAYSGCSITNLIIPDRVTNIGDRAFAGCAYLTNVTLPSSLTNLGTFVFSGCTSLQAITVDAFNPDFSSLDGVLFDKGKTTILAYPQGTSGDYNIPNGVSYIGWAFQDCARLTRITISSSVTNFGELPFGGCTNLNAISVEPLNREFSSLEGVLFNKRHTLLVRYPPGKNGSYTIPNSTRRIADFAFEGCGLSDVMLGTRVALIGFSAFGDSARLSRVELPNSLTTIEPEAFANCVALTRVTIPSRVTQIGGYAFAGCFNLKMVAVEAHNPAYSSVAGVLFDKNQTTLIQYPLGRAGSYLLPSSVLSIADFAFAGCTGLASVAGGPRLASIGYAAFSGCSKLTMVTLGPRLASIGDSAFASCSSLTVVHFQGNAPKVADSAFDYDDLATVYYRSGARGWNWDTVDCPTALWNGLYTVVVDTSSSGSGGVSGGATFVGGHVRTVHAVANPGYLFVNWTEYGTVVSTSANYSFTLLGDRDLVANFAPNPFPAVAGTYYGLICDTNAAAPQSSGCLTITVTSRGLCSGSLQLGGSRYSVSGRFDLTGQLSVVVPVRNSTLTLELDLSQGSERISGTVSNAHWTAQVVGDRSLFNTRTQPANNYAGRYTMAIPGSAGSTNEPAGDSWGTISVSPSGLVRLSASLGDGTKLTQAAPLSNEGFWPLYRSLYGYQGLILGWMGFTNTSTTDLSGNVLWMKPGHSKLRPYPDGFEFTSTALGSRYLPALGLAALNLTNAQLVLTGPGLPQDVTNYVTLQTHSLVSSNNHTRLAFSLSTGVFRGSIRDPDHPQDKPLCFSGVVLQKQNDGCGWFIETSQCGEVHLSQ